ncbi:MAG: NPCBM/NEW2 domain-containing protein, partial [Tepidisphaeraceae bacterium]
KSGNSITFSVGTEQSGTLVSEVTTTIGDVRGDCPYLNDQNGHLFFGSGAFKQLAIGKGPAPVAAEAEVAQVADAVPAETPPANAQTPQTTGDETATLGKANQTGGVYLSDLAPLSVSTFTDGTWGFGNKGHTGAGDTLISVLGAPSPHGLGTHPPSSGAAVVKYDLGGNYARFTGTVAVDDDVDRCNSVLIFRVTGDGHDIWRAAPIQSSRKPQAFDIDVSGVKKLELVVDCPGEHSNCHAVWLEPELFRAARRAVVNLIPLIDVNRDSVNGKWISVGGTIVSDDSQYARLRIPYQPPQEYDFHMEFTRLSGNEGVVQMFTNFGHSCMWNIGAWANTTCGFTLINGLDSKDNGNPSRFQSSAIIQNGRKYSSLIQVRKGSVVASIDGKVISRCTVDPSQYSFWDGWSIGPNALGIGSFTSPTVFSVIEVTDVNGAETATSATDHSSAAPTAPLDPIFKDTPRELIHSMKGTYASFDGGVYVIRQDGQRISTTESYKPPVAFRLVAQTDSTNIRMAYAADQIIFNWEDGPDELRIDGGPANGRHQAHAGNVPINKWVTIDEVVYPDSMAIFVDGKQRYFTTANFSKVNDPFSIFQGASSVVKVRSLLVGQPK